MTESSSLLAPLADSPNWWQALTLAERLPAAPSFPVPDERRAQRLQRWRTDTAFLDNAAFAAHLQQEGLSTATLAGLLGEFSRAPGVQHG